MGKDLLTVAEVALAVGVTKQAIYKRLNSTLNEFVEVVDGRKMLNNSVVAFLSVEEINSNVEGVETKFNINDKESSTVDNDFLSFKNMFNLSVDMWNNQLSEKDMLVERLTGQVETLTKEVQNKMNIIESKV